MSEPLFKIVLQGVDQNASASVDKVVDKLNKAKEATKKWNDERSRLARQDRVDKFRQLSDEEKLVRLRERQVQIEQRLATATRQGNQMRVAALRLAAARNRVSMGGSARSGGVGGGGGGAGAADALGSLTGGAAGLGGLAGGPVGAIIGAGVASVGYAMSKAVTSAMEFADNISNLADQTGLTRIQLLKLQRASGAAGVSAGASLNGISAIANARSAALGGDQSALANFGRFGISAQTLGSGADNLQIAQAIQQAYSAGGSSASDRGALSMLLGSRPERTIAALKALGNVSIANPNQVEADLEKLASVKARFEDIMNRWQLVVVASSSALFKAVDAITPFVETMWNNSKVGMLSNMLTATGTQQLGWADKRRADDAIPGTTTPAMSSGSLSSMALPQGDSLSRIGLYRGGIDPARADILRSQLETLRMINSNTSRTVVAIEGKWS